MGLIRDTYRIYIANDGTPCRFEIVAGRASNLSLTAYDVDLAQQALAGWTVRMSARRRPYDSALLKTWTATVSGSTMTFAIAATDFAALSWQEGAKFQTVWCDIEATDASSNARPVCDGQLNFLFPMTVWQAIRGAP